MAEWSKNQSATVEALSQVLAVIDRKDIIQMLYSDARSLQRSYGPGYYTLQNISNSMRPQNGCGVMQPGALHNISQHSMQQAPMANYLQQQQQFGNHYAQPAPPTCYPHQPTHLVNTQSPKTQTPPDQSGESHTPSTVRVYGFVDRCF